MVSRRIRCAVVGLTSLALLAGCGESTDIVGNDSAPVSGGSLVDLANFAAGDPDNIDPALANDVQSAQIADLLYDGLTAVDTQGRVVNAVARSYTSSDDAKVWTFTLRDDVKFSNGDTVEASDFKFAWSRVLDTRLASRLVDRFSNIAVDPTVAPSDPPTLQVTADDAANTLRVVLNEGDRNFPALVSLPVFSPLPAKAAPAATYQEGVMVGNGPFTMAEPWKKGQYIKLARNSGYYGGPANHLAYLERLEFRISQNLDSAYTAFTANGGQVARIPSGQYATIKQANTANVVDSPLMGTEYWGFNMADPVVGGADNLKLRQAIAAAIDKGDVNAKVYSGGRQEAMSFAPPSTPGYQAGASVNTPDVEGAKRLLTEYGKPAPAIKVSYNAGAGHEDKAAIIVANLQAAGIPAVNDPLEAQAYRQGVMGGTLQFFRFAWIADYVSYDNMLAPSFLSTSGPDNVTRYSNAEFDRLVIDARRQSDEDRRNEAYRNAEKIVLGDQAVVPLTWVTASLVKAPSVNDLAVNPLGVVEYSEAWLSQ